MANTVLVELAHGFQQGLHDVGYLGSGDEGFIQGLERRIWAVVHDQKDLLLLSVDEKLVVLDD